MQNSSKGNNSWKNHRTRTRRWYAHPPSILNIPMKFQWNPTSSFREFAWTRTVPYIFMQNSSKGNNSWKNHRTRTRRWYGHPPLILNIPMKFHWNPTSSFREFAWTRAGRTHGRTDTRTYGRTDAQTHGRTDARTKRRLYAPPKFFGEHKNNLSQFLPTKLTVKWSRKPSNYCCLTTWAISGLPITLMQNCSQEKESMRGASGYAEVELKLSTNAAWYEDLSYLFSLENTYTKY